MPKLKKRGDIVRRISCLDGGAMMNKRGLAMFALIVGFLVLSNLIGGIGCQGGRTESDSLIIAAQEAVFSNMKQLDEQKHEKLSQLLPLEIDLDNVQSQITRIGTGGGGEGWDLLDIGGLGGGGGIGGG